MARLKELYRKEVIPALTKQFGYKSSMQVPRISKIVLNMGVGEAIADKKILDNAVGDMQKITGQKPVTTKAKKSIAIWKIRTGYPLGCMVTLRQDRMYEFLDRLVSIAIPRIRDFRGLNPRSFDGRGNYSLGVKEQIIFPEIDYDAIDQVRGLDITITTSATGDVEAYALLQALGMPFATQGRPRGFDPAADAADAAGSTDRDGASTKAAAPSEAAPQQAQASEEASDAPEAEPEAPAESPEAEAPAGRIAVLHRQTDVWDAGPLVFESQPEAPFGPILERFEDHTTSTPVF